ncbi:glycosyltransferase [Haloechinothrix sp. YIM 98757]|uniref:Glycosyltransferase n=1 Tax=Haloechinothrix aidingensis TaxID=2752311 RepID=A0A838A5N1_9PSEU|nr:glycosyltransferase [Haloechinothrix aidingensis]MBA0125070.1 glycosyltransferase [Haloechinothrix aidingensis]
MRILQIHNEYAQPGGEDAAADAQASLLTAAGHRVDRVRTRNRSSGAGAAAAFAGAVWNPASYAGTRRAARRVRPDVAHLHNWWFGLSPSVVDALHAERVPVVMTLHNYRLLCANGLLFRDGGTCTDCLGTHTWRAVRHGCYRDSRAQSAVAAATLSVGRERATWDRVTRFVAPSRFVKDIHVQAGFDAGRITVAPNVVTDPGPRSARPSDSPTVLCVSRLSREKGVDALLEAWRASADAMGELRLLVLGDGPERERLERSAPAGVRIAGRTSPSEVRRAMCSARALVVPSECYETFGLVALEAMAAGLPVLSADVAGPAEVVGGLGPEWLVPASDTRAWAAALPSLTSDGTVDSSGVRARELFERGYTPSAVCRALLGAYAEAIEEVRAG